MNKLLRLRKSKKGFTLVELLVVIVIIAILMAAIIPSMLGFIDKAKEETAKAECRNVLLAANTVLNEEYGLGKTLTSVDLAKADADPGKAIFTKIKDMADLKQGEISNLTVSVDPTDKTKGVVITTAAYAHKDSKNTYTYTEIKDTEDNGTGKYDWVKSKTPSSGGGGTT